MHNTLNVAQSNNRRQVTLTVKIPNLSFWHHASVDTVYDAVRCFDVQSNGLSRIDHNGAGRIYGQLGPFDSCNVPLFAGYVGGHDFSRHDMIGKNFD